MIDRRVIYTLLSVDSGVALFTFLQGNYIWFINTQIAFFTTLGIVFGTYISYRKSVLKRVESYDPQTPQQDDIDKIDDPYQLYDDEESEKSSIDIVNKDEVDEKKLLKEEKANLNKNTIRNTVKSFGAYSSIYRLVGYLFLVLGFFYLQSNNLLDVASYIIGVSIAPISLIIATFLIKKQNIEENS
jgi:hypothetical protein